MELGVRRARERERSWRWPEERLDPVVLVSIAVGKVWLLEAVRAESACVGGGKTMEESSPPPRSIR